MYGKLDYLAIVPPAAQKAVSDTPVLWTQLYINVTHNMLSVYNSNCQYFVKIKICLRDVSCHLSVIYALLTLSLLLHFQHLKVANLATSKL